MLGSEPLSECSDRELVEQAKTSPQAFKLLVDRFWRRLYAFIKRLYFFEHEEIEDVLQEAFIKIYRNLEGFDETYSFSTWAYQITRNCAIDTLRKKRVRPQTISFTDEEWDTLKVAAEEETQGEPHSLEAIKRVITELPIHYREPFTLFYLEGKSYEEMVDILKKPKGTIASAIRRAKLLIQERLSSL